MFNGDYAKRLELAEQLDSEFFKAHARLLLFLVNGVATGMRRVAEAKDPLHIICAVTDVVNHLLSVVTDGGNAQHIAYMWDQTVYGRR